MFELIFQQEPVIDKQGIYYFSPTDTGDYFDEDDVTSWRNGGLEIIYEAPYLFRQLSENDNELGEAASRFGVNIGLQFTAFIVRKK